MSPLCASSAGPKYFSYPCHASVPTSTQASTTTTIRRIFDVPPRSGENAPDPRRLRHRGSIPPGPSQFPLVTKTSPTQPKFYRTQPPPPITVSPATAHRVPSAFATTQRPPHNYALSRPTPQSNCAITASPSSLQG